eukprot:CAMPEP_0118936092 /NCGR_PEP_ID=MMETSP1169-20130426/16007_1 /TAXON_ID=36882 /ORGANISM="Pyramimonas obovata, Strain CCMP722" /LENGTH=233 /DNA_ID=CAMNT_0006879203 /DNA_START=171 /DNA_END=872 /DNA_ORIENTATION=+
MSHIALNASRSRVREAAPALASKAQPSVSLLRSSVLHRVALSHNCMRRRGGRTTQPRSSRGRLQVCAILNDAKKLGSAVLKAEELFKKYDVSGGNGKGSDGELSMDEVVQLLNSEDYKSMVSEMLGVDAYKQRSEEEISALFKKMDTDGSGSLSRTEFIMLWLALVRERTQTNPKLVALVFCRFLDENKDGKVTINEVKRFLALLGPLGAGLSMIPMSDKMGLDYEKIFGDGN